MSDPARYESPLDRPEQCRTGTVPTHPQIAWMAGDKVEIEDRDLAAMKRRMG